jgi:DNA-binding NtrC family response regulator
MAVLVGARRPAPSAVLTELRPTAIFACHGNLTLVAKELRISKSTLYLKVKKYGLDKLVPVARVSVP